MPIPTPLFLTGQNLAFTHDAATVPARLTAHARTMAQGVYQVAEDFYVAVGYGQANMTMVVGTDGVILIDCLETEEAARRALGDLRKVSDKPIKALIYTHSHPDHISGVRGHPRSVRDRIGTGGDLRARASGSHEAGQSEPRAHAPLAVGLHVRFRPRSWPRGLGGGRPGDRSSVVGTIGFLPPTTVFHGSLDIEVAGITRAPARGAERIGR